MMCACLRCKLPKFPYKGMTNPNCTCTCVPASWVRVSLGYKFTNLYPNPNQTHELTPGYSPPMPFPRDGSMQRIILGWARHWVYRRGICQTWWKNSDWKNNSSVLQQWLWSLQAKFQCMWVVTVNSSVQKQGLWFRCATSRGRESSDVR